MARTAFDLVVLGTGAAGSAAAQACRAAGWSVAIVDSRPYGGTCALRGCDPKKVLVGIAEVVAAGRRLSGKGVAASALRIDWPALAAFKRSFVEGVPAQVEEKMRRAGVAAYHGSARFVGPTSVEVGEDVLDGRYVLVATGARPADLEIAGQAHVTDSERFLELAELPSRIVFLGSGYISFEFAHVAATAGASVTMLEMLERPLAGFDPDLVSVLVEGTRRMGIDLRLETKVTAVGPGSHGLVVKATSAAGEQAFEADLVVHGAGRVPDIDDLGLDVAGVERAKRGVQVNEYLQSVSNPKIYAAGDAAAAGPMLTPVAAHEGRLAAANMLGGNARRTDFTAVPSVAFTLPPLASVGLQEEEARSRGLAFAARFTRTADWYSARRLAEEVSAHKILVEEGSGRILGAHVIGPTADEVINVFALAMRAGIAAPDLKQATFAYPTAGSNVSSML